MQTFLKWSDTLILQQLLPNGPDHFETLYIKGKSVLYTLENWISNLVTFFCHISYNSEWNCAVFWKFVKNISYPFSAKVLSPKLRESLKYSLSYLTLWRVAIIYSKESFMCICVVSVNSPFLSKKNYTTGKNFPISQLLCYSL